MRGFISEPTRWRNRKPLKKREGEEKRGGYEPVGPFLISSRRFSYEGEALGATPVVY